MSADDEIDIQLFKQFLRIETTHPNPKLGECVEWLKAQAVNLGLLVVVHEFHAGFPVVVLTQLGQDASLPSVVLNCHMDVVPFVAEKWDKLPANETPFSAYEDANGNIYARGAQDMKSVGAQYLCALRRLKAAGKTFLRTIHLLWVPDEEIGGPLGMQAFIKSGLHKSLNIGVALDEGLAHDENSFVVYYGERSPLWVVLKAEGPVGHASKLIENTAADRIAHVVAELTRWRDENVSKLKEGDSVHVLGDVTSINWTYGHHGTTSDGGKSYAYNVIPNAAAAGFDVRLAPDDFDRFMSTLDDLVKKYDLQIEWPVGQPNGRAELSSRTSGYFKAIVSSLGKWGATVVPAVFPAATDSRFLRKAGVQAYGFSPMRNIKSTLHDHNEFLPRSTFIEGVAVYCDLISTLANLPNAVDGKL